MDYFTTFFKHDEQDHVTFFSIQMEKTRISWYWQEDAKLFHLRLKLNYLHIQLTILGIRSNAIISIFPKTLKNKIIPDQFSGTQWKGEDECKMELTLSKVCAKGKNTLKHYIKMGVIPPRTSNSAPPQTALVNSNGASSKVKYSRQNRMCTSTWHMMNNKK